MRSHVASENVEERSATTPGPDATDVRSVCRRYCLDGLIVGGLGTAGVAGGWWDRARCVETDPEAFFLDRGTPWAAKRVCDGCDVRGECLEYALAHDERFGVWGGLTEAERQHLRRRVS